VNRYGSHWQMRDVMNEALRRMYIACKSQSGFPGKMPAGSDVDDYNVPVQAILEGLGLIPSLEAENVPFESFDSSDQDRNVWQFGDISKSAMSSQATENIVPSMVRRPVTTSLRALSRHSDDSAATSPFVVPAVRKDNFQPAMALPHRINNGTTFTSNPGDFASEISTVHQHYQMLYQSGLGSKTPLWPGTIATPFSGSYDFSYSYLS
jgi:hypothetical protein